MGDIFHEAISWNKFRHISRTEPALDTNSLKQHLQEEIKSVE